MNPKLRFALIASLTLGLAPFTPEPHIWGKLKWIAGGAEGMELIDWGDTLMHGIPWVLLIVFGSQHMLGKSNLK